MDIIFRFFCRIPIAHNRQIIIRIIAMGFHYFSGGRARQRAYYDTLKDYAHLSALNPDLSPILRFNIFEFESVAKKSFLNIPMNNLIVMIKDKINYLSEIKYLQ